MAFTRLFLTTGTPVYTPATIRGAWDITAGSVTKALSPQKINGGLLTTVAVAETNTDTTWDVLLYRGITTPLDSQTIPGTMDVMLRMLESNAAADFYWHIHIYATQGDTDTPRGTLLDNYIENTTNEFPTTATAIALQSAQTLTAVALTGGDRLVIEIGYIARNASATSYTGTLAYGTQDTSTYATVESLTVGSTSAVLCGYIEFSNSIVELEVDQRVSQVNTELLNEGSSEQRVSQVLTELINEGSSEQRVSQVLTELINEGSSEQRVSQVVVELFGGLSPNSIPKSYGFIVG